MTTPSITLSHDQATRLLHSLQHLHTLHGPCDGPTCPHAAVLRELEGMIYLASASLNPDEWRTVNGFSVSEGHKGSETCPNCSTKMVNPKAGEWNGHKTAIWWCPTCKENWTIVGQSDQDPEFQAVAPFPCHDLADALLRLTTSPPPYTPTPRLCAACGTTLPSTTSAGTNLCGRCAL